MTHACRRRPTIRTSSIVAATLAVTGCLDLGPAARTVRLNLQGTVQTDMGEPIQGALVSLRDGGSACVNLVRVDVPRPLGAPDVRQEISAEFAALSPTAAPPIGPLCFTIASAETDADGGYQIIDEYSDAAPSCGSSLSMRASKVGYLGSGPTSGRNPACTRQVQVFDFMLTDTFYPPTLLEPLDQAAIPQNVAATGCPAHPTAGSGYMVHFDWLESVGPADQVPLYHLIVQGPGAESPLISQDVQELEFTYVSCGFVDDQNLEGWTWRVGTHTVGAGEASNELRHFRFEPCRLSSGEPCHAAASVGNTGAD